jgi:hypothetical protein
MTCRSTHMSPLMPYYRFKNPSIPARAPGKARRGAAFEQGLVLAWAIRCAQLG